MPRVGFAPHQNKFGAGSSVAFGDLETLKMGKVGLEPTTLSGPAKVLVPPRGFEPLPLSRHGPKPCVSASSTTGAKFRRARIPVPPQGQKLEILVILY